MRKSFINNTFWLFAAAFALLLKWSIAGAQVQPEPLAGASESLRSPAAIH